MSARSLLLSDLLIGIAPSADFQPPAYPAQRLFRIWRARRTADRALFDALDLIRDNRTLRLSQKLLVNHWLGCRQRFASHYLNNNTDSDRGSDRRALRRPVHPHDVSRIQRRRTARAFLARFHHRPLSVTDDCSFHRVCADGAVHVGVPFELDRLGLSLKVHVLTPFCHWCSFRH
jgi:hypothetical protein